MMANPSGKAPKGTAGQSFKLIVAEVVLLVLSGIGLFIELGRRRYLSDHPVRPPVGLDVRG